jgi:hypothetical protein
MTTAALALGTLLSTSISAHHAPAALGTVRLTQPVMAGGKMLQAGTYEIRDTGEHATPLPGQSDEAQTYVEFVANGTVAARDIAEVMTSEAVAVGTSGATSGGTSTRARVEMLKGGDFMRVSMSRGGQRYLIHMPVAR